MPCRGFARGDHVAVAARCPEYASARQTLPLGSCMVGIGAVGKRVGQMTRRSWALFAAMCVIWGIPYLLIRVAVRDIEPGTLVFLRTAIGGLILLPIAFGTGGFKPVLSRWFPLLAFAVIEMAIPWLLLSDAERKV